MPNTQGANVRAPVGACPRTSRLPHPLGCPPAVAAFREAA